MGSTSYVPAAIGAIVLLVCTAAMVASLQTALGEVVLPADDPYIHLALARTLAGHGVWSIDPTMGFSSPSSSPGWIVLLAACMAALGPHTWVPIAINTVVSLVFVGSLARYFAEEGLGTAVSAAAIVGIVLLVPLPSMTTLAMEHVLQLWLSFELVVRGSRQVAGGPGRGVLILAAIAPMVRYEALFLVLPLGVALLAHRRLLDAASLAGAAAAPIAAFGAWSVAHGGWVLPTSVVVKMASPALGSRWDHVAENLLSAGLMVPLGLAIGLLAVRRGSLALGLFAVAAALQLVFARTGWAFRYEAWCVGVGLALAAPALQSRPLAMVALLALVPRAWTSMERTPAASRDVFTVWWWPAELVRRTDRAPVGANALGLMAWRADRRVVDLDGLDSVPIARLWLGGRFPEGALEGLVAEEGVATLFVSPSWFEMTGVARTTWRPVASWIVRGRYAGDLSVTGFYATSEAAAVELREALEAAPLPEEVVVVRLDGDHPVPTVLEGEAVLVEPLRVAFYTNGRVRWAVDRPSECVLTVGADVPEGAVTGFSVARDGGLPVADLIGAVAERRLIRVRESFEVEFAFDRVDPGFDWNLHVWDVRCGPG